MAKHLETVHMTDHYDRATLCGLSTSVYSSTPILEAVTCKVCLKIATQGHR